MMSVSRHHRAGNRPLIGFKEDATVLAGINHGVFGDRDSVRSKMDGPSCSSTASADAIPTLGENFPIDDDIPRRGNKDRSPATAAVIAKIGTTAGASPATRTAH